MWPSIFNLLLICAKFFMKFDALRAIALILFRKLRLKSWRMLFNISIWVLQGDDTTWEIHSRTRLRVKVVCPYSILNVLAQNGQWVLRKMSLKISLTLYTTKLICLPVGLGLIGSASVCHAEDLGSRLKCATNFFFNYYYLFN